jgi:hypothetical protein
MPLKGKEKMLDFVVMEGSAESLVKEEKVKKAYLGG